MLTLTSQETELLIKCLKDYKTDLGSKLAEIAAKRMEEGKIRVERLLAEPENVYKELRAEFSIEFKKEQEEIDLLKAKLIQHKRFLATDNV